MQFTSLEIIEIIAVVLNVAYVLLAAFEKRLCWIFGGIASVLSVYLFYKNQLPSEAFLYIFYFIMAVFGFVQWNKNKKSATIKKWKLKSHIKAIAVSIGLAGIFYLYSTFFIDAAKPAIDAFTTAFSIVATFMVINKILSNWIYWIVIDLVTFFLYQSRGLDYYAGLMIVFSLLAVLGYIKWQKQYRETKALISQ